MEIADILGEALSNGACKKHPVSCVIETPDGSYIPGWNGAPSYMKHYECARIGLPSGVGMELCPTVHAERRAISHAARDGKSTNGSVLYMSEWFPCADCAKSIIEAGIMRLVTPDDFYEDRKRRILLPMLRGQSYNFEMSEKLLFEAGLDMVVEPGIRPQSFTRF